MKTKLFARCRDRRPAVIESIHPSAFAGDATTELKALVGKIRDDLADGKTNKADLADDLKQFDVLLAEHQGEKTDAVANIVYMKAMLYDQILHDPAKAAELVKQLKLDFQGTEFVAALEKREAAQMAAEKMQAALTVGAQFPDFNEKDVDGKPLSIASYKGKVVLGGFLGDVVPAVPRRTAQCHRHLQKISRPGI